MNTRRFILSLDWKAYSNNLDWPCPSDCASYGDLFGGIVKVITAMQKLHTFSLLVTPNARSVIVHSLLLQALAKYFRAGILQALQELVQDLHVNVVTLDSRGDFSYAQTAGQPYIRTRGVCHRYKITNQVSGGSISSAPISVQLCAG
jgi:hypothetical protein